MNDAATFPGNRDPEIVKLPTFTLRDDRGWLNLDGTGVTSVKAHRYRGTFEQARKMRQISAVAKGMTITNL